MTAACIFLPVILGALVKLRFKLSKVGLAMLISLFLSFSAQFYLSLYHSRLLTFTNDSFKDLSLGIVVILLLFSLAMQIYFIMEMKRVRIYVESRTPLELQIAESRFCLNKFIMCILIISMFVSFTIAGLVLKRAKGNADNNFMTSDVFTLILVSSLIFLITFGYLLAITFRQYHFFI